MMTTFGCASILALATSVTLNQAPPPESRSVAVKSARAPRTAPPQRRAASASSPAPAPLAKPMKGKRAPEAPAAALLMKVQAYYGGITDYRADFIQKYTKVALSRTSESRGVLMLKKPGSMRWAYTKPAEKLWVVDDDTLYVVDPEFEQVFIDKNFKTEELQSSISFLWGRGRLDESFDAKLGEAKTYGAADGRGVLELRPKKGATYTKLVLIVDQASGAVTESIIYETAGNTNHFVFRNPKHNTKLGPELFQYTPPESYEVVYR